MNDNKLIVFMKSRSMIVDGRGWPFIYFIHICGSIFRYFFLPFPSINNLILSRSRTLNFRMSFILFFLFIISVLFNSTWFWHFFHFLECIIWNTNRRISGHVGFCFLEGLFRVILYKFVLFNFLSDIRAKVVGSRPRNFVWIVLVTI